MVPRGRKVNGIRGLVCRRLGLPFRVRLLTCDVRHFRFLLDQCRLDARRRVVRAQAPPMPLWLLVRVLGQAGFPERGVPALLRVGRRWFVTFPEFGVLLGKARIGWKFVLKNQQSVLHGTLLHSTISWVVFVNAIKKIAFQKQPIFLLNGEVMWQASDSPLSTKELHECYKTFLKVNLQSLHFPAIWNISFQYILHKSSLLSIFVQRSMTQKKFVVNFLIFSIHFSKPFLSTFTIESAYKKLYEFVSFGFAVLTVILRLN